jgi:hypothetical protein
MAIFSQDFKRIARHSFETFLYALFVLAAAYCLTIFHDYCEQTHRPIWFTFGVEVLSVVLFIADSIAVTMMVMLGLYHTLKSAFKRR